MGGFHPTFVNYQTKLKYEMGGFINDSATSRVKWEVEVEVKRVPPVPVDAAATRISVIVSPVNARLLTFRNACLRL